jgi:hypothetical protein
MTCLFLFLAICVSVIQDSYIIHLLNQNGLMQCEGSAGSNGIKIQRCLENVIYMYIVLKYLNVTELHTF